MNGYTYDPSPAERAANEVHACLEMIERYPQNEYWQKRLAAALVAEQEERCCCYEFIGDNPNCPVHGHYYPKPVVRSEIPLAV